MSDLALKAAFIHIHCATILELPLDVRIFWVWFEHEVTQNGLEVYLLR